MAFIIIVIFSVYIICSSVVYIFKTNKESEETSSEMTKALLNIKFFLLASFTILALLAHSSLMDEICIFSVGVLYLIFEFLFSKIAYWFINLSIWEKLRVYIDYKKDKQ